MAEITAGMVKTLREKTDAPMMECKKALSEAAGDMDKAIEILRSQFTKATVKREGNETAEGRVGVFVEPAAQTAAILEVRCETAPTAKNERTIELAYDLARQVASAAAENVPQLLAQPYSAGSGTVQDRINEVVGVIREKMIVHRFERLKADSYGHYVHHDGSVGVLLGCTGKGGTDEALRDVCAHVAALNPQYMTAAEVPADTTAKEKALILVQIEESEKAAKEKAEAEGKKYNQKNASILDKIAEGKLKTWMAESVLTEQPMANKDKYPNKTVGQLLQGFGLTPVRFVRYKVGATAV